MLYHDRITEKTLSENPSKRKSLYETAIVRVPCRAVLVLQSLAGHISACFLLTAAFLVLFWQFLFPQATIIIFQRFRRGKKNMNWPLHTHAHTHTHAPSGSLEQVLLVFGFSFTLVMPLSRYKKHLIPDFLLLALGLWPVKWNVFFAVVGQPAAELSEREGKGKKWKKKKKGPKWKCWSACEFAKL